MTLHSYAQNQCQLSLLALCPRKTPRGKINGKKAGPLCQQLFWLPVMTQPLPYTGHRPHIQPRTKTMEKEHQKGIFLPTKKEVIFFPPKEPLLFDGPSLPAPFPKPTKNDRWTLLHTNLLTGYLQTGMNSSYIFGCRWWVSTIHHVRLSILSFPMNHSNSQP